MKKFCLSFSFLFAIQITTITSLHFFYNSFPLNVPMHKWHLGIILHLSYFFSVEMKWCLGDTKKLAILRNYELDVVFRHLIVHIYFCSWNVSDTTYKIWKLAISLLQCARFLEFRMQFYTLVANIGSFECLLLCTHVGMIESHKRICYKYMPRLVDTRHKWLKFISASFISIC